VLHVFQLLTCAPIGGAVGDAWAVLISSTSTPHPIRRTQTKREGAPLAHPQPLNTSTTSAEQITTDKRKGAPLARPQRLSLSPLCAYFMRFLIL
jgi:hypothetical protein